MERPPSQTSARPAGGLAETISLVALRTLPVAVWLADATGQIDWMNDAAVALVGSVGRIHFSALLAAESVNDARELFSRIVLGVVAATSQPVRLRGRSGELRAELASVPIRRLGEVVGVLTAITAHVEHVPAAVGADRPKLTPRQHEVLLLLADGCSTDQIAARLQIAEETARNHINQLLAKLGAHSRLQAVVVAGRNGWL
jgi:DNA-binding CsgD family transcriptional regulator